ncbi:MAG: carboxymuconolactone decarboxylase family protein [Planctomycetota bacterium]
MPTLPKITAENTTNEEVRGILSGPLKAYAGLNIFQGLANSPAGLKAYAGLNEALSAGSLSKKEIEAIQLVVSEANGCDYCIAAHTAIGTQAGLTEDQTVAARKADSLGNAKLDAVITFAKAIQDKKGFADQGDIDAFKAAGHDDAVVVEVIVAFTLATFTNYFNHINQTEVDFPAVPALA